MNKWKIAFWCCLLLLFITNGFLVYSIVDQGVTLTYQEEGYSQTEDDLDEIINIINNTNLSKSEVKKEFDTHSMIEYMDFDSDTVSLYRLILIFRDNQLEKIEKQW